MSFTHSNRRHVFRGALGLVLSLAACSAPPSDAPVHEGHSRSSGQALSRATSVSPAGALSGRFTNFDPTVDGFKFTNDFTNVFGPVETSGLCGGMSYTALDYFNAKKTIPQQNYRPEENTPLQSYIYGRQETSTANNVTNWAGYLVNPLGENNGHLLADTFAREIPLVVSSIDQGNPIPLGLGGTNGTGNHQVLAIGYYVDPNQNLDQIYLYDPNFPASMRTLVFDVRNQVFTEAEDPLKEEWVGFFADTNYGAQAPPTVPEPIYPDDGLIHELYLAVDTGANALQNGANAALQVFLTDGTNLSFTGLNLNEKWVPNYSETVRIPVSPPLDPHRIASITLGETDQCVPWDVTSARVQAVGSSTWVLATGGPQTLACGAASETLSIVQLPPAITSVNPCVMPGATVVITGTGFHTDGSTRAVVGGVPVNPSCTSSSQCTVVVPAGASSTGVTLSEPVLESNLAYANPPAALETFSVTAAPSVFTCPASPACSFTLECNDQIAFTCTMDSATTPDPVGIYEEVGGQPQLVWYQSNAGAPNGATSVVSGSLPANGATSATLFGCTMFGVQKVCDPPKTATLAYCPPPPPPPPACTTPQSCCKLGGGRWVNNQCITDCGTPEQCCVAGGGEWHLGHCI